MNSIVSEMVSFSNAWWPWMAHAAWQSALVGILLLALAWMMRRSSAPLRHGMLVVALLKFAVPPLFIVSLALLPAAFTLGSSADLSGVATGVGIPVAAEVSTAAALPKDAPTVDASQARSATAALPAATNSAGLAARLPGQWKLLLLGVQVVGGLSVALLILRGIIGTMRFANRCEIVDDGALWQTFCRVRRRMGFRRAVQLLLSPEDCTPVAVGILRPSVILPKSLVEQMDPVRLEAVLAHELAHHRRGDLWIMTLESLLMVVWWFHPVFWLVRRELRALREDCCDDILLDAHVADGQSYCETLMQAAGHAVRPRRAQAALGIAERFHPLGRRFMRIMDAPLVRSTRLSRSGLATLAVLALVLWPGARFIQETAQAESQAAPPAAAKAADPELPAKTDQEIQEHYAKADADVQAYIRWTAENFGRNGLWLPADAFAGLSAEEREKKVTTLVETLKGEYGRYLCPALAEAGALKDKRLLPGISKAAAYHREDGDYDCRAKWMAVAAVGRQDDIWAVPILVPLVDHGNQNTRMWARASLVRLTGQNFSADKQAWGKWWNESGNQPPIDLSQLKPWVAPEAPAPQASANMPPPPPSAAPPQKLAELPGAVLFEGRYRHFSRGSAINEPQDLWIKKDGTKIGILSRAPFLRGVTVACGDEQNKPPLGSYESLADNGSGQLSSQSSMTIQPGKVKVTRKNEQGETINEEYTVPGGAWFDPNSRPDPYCAAQLLLQTQHLKQGEAQELDVYDWDNTGKGMAAYKIRLTNNGRETAEVPAGKFEANHIVLEQLTSGDTWYKKRAGHLTDFWVLDNGVIVRILRHREPYEIQLLDWKAPAELPGLTKK